MKCVNVVLNNLHALHEIYPVMVENSVTYFGHKKKG